MSVPSPAAIVRDAYRALQAGDMDAFSSLLDDHVHWYAPERGPWDCHSRADVLSVMQRQLAEGEVELVDVQPFGEQLLVEALRLIAGEGHPRRSFNLVTVRDGRIVEIQALGRSRPVRA